MRIKTYSPSFIRIRKVFAMDIQFERSYPTPVSCSLLLPLLLLSLARQKHTPHVSTWINNEYDYIVVGGGAAGSVVASRLSEESRVSVLLLEAGHKPPLLTEVPSFRGYFLGTDVDWNFKTVSQKHAATGLVNRQVKWASGKMLGGSGNHNGMAYVRGNKKNFDDWAAQGAKGWSYLDVLHYFLKLEDNTDANYLKNGYHAAGGPITVERPRYNPKIKQALQEAAISLGYEFVDSNAGRQTGFYDLQGNMRDNQRCSSVKGYLVPAENRTNLDILLNAMVTKIYKKFIGPHEGTPFFSCESQQLQPKSRGTVTLSSPNPFDPPLIDPNYLEHPSDLQDLVDGLKSCKILFTTEPLLKLGVKPLETLVPGCEMFQESDDEYFSCYAKTLTFTNYHAVGTCKMGDPQDPNTVVDPELRVKGIKGLRVVDASIMPIVPSGNIHIPTLMVAEKASDIIKESLYKSFADSFQNFHIQHSFYKSLV